MNATAKKVIIATGIFAIIAAPAAVFASQKAGGMENMGQMMGMKMGHGQMMGKMGMGEGMDKMSNGLLKNEKVRAALAASGVTLPTADEMKAYHEKMKAGHDAMDTLSEADKAELKKIHEEAMKKHREFLRSKGVNVPSEEEIAKMKAAHKSIADLVSKLPAKEKRKLEKKFGKMRDHDMGKMGGHGRDDGRFATGSTVGTGTAQ